MGGKWHVEVWGKWTPCSGAYSYMTVYMGESFIEAAAVFLRNCGRHGCVTLHRRGKDRP